jgi:lipopolysaccharide export system ATP-binding protein
MSAPAALEVRGLVKSFAGRKVVCGVDLDVPAGSITGLLGPNGAGKTTVFRMIAGLLLPDAGTVHLAGQDVSSWPLHRRARFGLGYLSQVPTVFSGLSARDNVALVLEAQGLPASGADEILLDAGLFQLAGARAETLSGGERRRLELARVLAMRPSVLMLDEPFAGVDPVAVFEIQARVRILAQSGLAVLLTDHAVREALGVCDRVAVVDQGVLQCAGTPGEVAADPRVRERYLGDGFRMA